MTDVQYSRNWIWMTDEWLRLNTQHDTKQYQMIWNYLKWCCDVQSCQIQWNLNIEFDCLHTNYEMNKSLFEAKHSTIEIHEWLLMIFVSASQHYWTNTRTLICHYNRNDVNSIQQKSISIHIFKKRKLSFIIFWNLNIVRL